MYQPTADYPANKDGTPEFASLVLTIDHLATREDHHVVQKMVLSTQTDIETLLALFAYYGESHLTTNPKTIELLQQAGRSELAVFVYHTRENVQIVASTPTWDTLVQHPDFGKGSSLVATDALTQAVANLVGELRAANGGQVVPLFLVAPTLEKPEAVDPTRGMAAEMAERSNIQDVTEEAEERTFPVEDNAD